MLKLKLDLIVQQATSVDDALEESKRLKRRQLIVRGTETEVTRATKSKLLDIINNSYVEQLSLVWLPLSLQTCILSLLPNITKLYMDSFYIHPIYHVTIDFPNLKEVDCVRSEYILNIIGRHSIEKLSISYIKSKLYNFFERCNTLKELSMWGFSLRDDREFTNFQLEILNLDAMTDEAINIVTWDLASCRQFMKSQEQSLKELHIAYCDYIFTCEDLVVYALNKMNLKVLHAYYPIENGIVDKLNEQMRDLKVDFENNAVTESIIANCPMVERIDLSFGTHVFRTFLPLISKHMTNLKYLKVSINYPEEIDKIDAKFNHLESLDVILFHQSEIRYFFELLKCCPNVKYLKIYMPFIFDWDLLQLADFLTLIPNVVEILSVGNFGITDATMQIITNTENALKLKYLKFLVGHPEHFLGLTEKYRHSKINFIPLQYYIN